MQKMGVEPHKTLEFPLFFAYVLHFVLYYLKDGIALAVSRGILSSR